jgi:pilus assembly protein FimV
MAVQRDKVIASAEKLVAKGRIEPAIKEYERLLEDNPNDVNTLNRIGDLWVRLNRNDEAVKTFGKIADHYSKDGFFLKAIAIYKKINKLDPSKLDVYARLADLYAKQGLAMEAKSQYQVLADYYLKHGDPANALVIYRKISELDPNSINVHVKLADLYSQNNQTGEALKEYDRVGRMLLKRGMLDEAVQVFRRALKIDARNIELVESLVTALLEAKDYANAIQIVETALESNRDNPRLVGLWSRIQLAKGDAASAKSALERALGTHPDEPLIRETLADLYLKQSSPDRALEMLAPLSEKALSRGERGQAVEMLNRVLRVDAGHTPTLERLVGVYMRLNEETNILASMNSLAEAHITKGHYENAAKVLERLIQREPQNAQHRTKLAFVKSQTGGIDTLPTRQKTAHDAPLPMEIEEPVPTFDSAEEAAPALDFGMDSGPSFELDLSVEPASHAAATAAPPPRLAAAVDIAASELAAEEDDDLDFITEHLTEAEVFAKYGLAEKATEHLRAVIERAPKNLTAHERLYRILLDEGDVDAGRTAATQYISLLREKSDDDAISGVVQEFLARGHSLEAGAPAAAKKPTMERPRPATMERLRPPTMERLKPPTLEQPLPGEIAEPAGTELAEQEEEITFDLESGPSFESSLDLDADHAVSAAEPLIEPEPAMEAEPSLESEIEFTPELELDAAEEVSAEPAEEIETLPPEAEEPELSLESQPALELEPIAEETSEPETLPEPILSPEPAPEFGELEVGEAAPEVPAEPFFGVDAEIPHEPSTEEIGEVDFYIAQELFDDAKTRLEALLARYPGNPDLELRSRRVDNGIAAAKRAAATPPAPAAPARPATPPAAARRAPPPVPAPPTPPATLSKDEIESELLSAIPDEEEETIAAPPPPVARTAAPVAPPVEPAHEENLFADEDDFFDLAAELESELTEEEEPLALSEEEQSLEEIFKEFKRGVEQQLDSEDYDTHYNLGIAYKEMGLIDEAIGEFQLASKDPKRAVECASMLGLCFLEKGMPQLAIKWYRKGLEMPEISEDEHVGLLYDLGSAYMEVGDTKNAQKAFMEVYGMNTNYRDVVNRIKQLDAT